MDNQPFKDKKRSREYSLLINISVAAILLGMVVFVLIHGRMDPARTTETQDADSDTTRHATDERAEALRQKYIDRMKLYESETRAEIEQLHLSLWSPGSITELQEQEKKAIESFGENQFDAALTQLDELLEKVSGLQSIHREKFMAALENAQQAFTEGHSEQASSAINDALRYRPENRDAQQLKKRIDSMETVARLIREAEIARVENNLGKEIELLDEAIRHDPHRTELVQRHNRLTAKHRQQLFDNRLQQAYRALDSKDIKQARQNLLQLERMNGGHPSLARLSDKIKQLEKELSYQSLMAGARAAEQEDNWQQAESLYQQAKMIFPDRKGLSEHLQRASKINQYTRIMEQSLQRPQRLADSRIAASIEQIIQESAEQAEHSIRLQQMTTRLKNTIAEMSKPVAVTVHSDGYTHISVSGIGVIGKVTEYKLKEGLKPGRYLFKGERRGFRDKLVEVHIKPEQPVDIRVICDEAV